MSGRKVSYAILIILLTLAMILAGIIYYGREQALKVVFFNVGQGDAILIQQGNGQIIIDGGLDGQKMMEKVGEHVPFWDRNIEVIIATHPDQDHIGGLVDVMESYGVGQIIDNGMDTDSQIFKKYRSVIDERGIGRTQGRSGMVVKINEIADLTFLSPDGKQNKDNPKDTNAGSLVMKLAYSGQDFLFTGDITDKQEDDLIKSGQDIDIDFLKVSHHGSKYATSSAFLEKTTPREAVVSVGKNNRYGHPAEEVLERLANHGIEIKRTDSEGDIEYEF